MLKKKKVVLVIHDLFCKTEQCPCNDISVFTFWSVSDRQMLLNTLSVTTVYHFRVII